MTLPKGESSSGRRIIVADKDTVNVIERKIELFGFTIYRNVFTSRWVKEKDE